MSQDVLSMLKEELIANSDNESATSEIQFYIHYIKTIQKKYRFTWLKKRCSIVEKIKKEPQEPIIKIVYNNKDFYYPTYGHACLHVLMKEVQKDKIKMRIN